ncbi:AIPL1 (predicted) [Pycnogonum litorale]
MSLKSGEKVEMWQKNIRYAGRGEVPMMLPGSKVVFHFQTAIDDDNKTVLDDSRQMNHPMELIIGKKFKLEVWEEFVKTMRVGEVSSFVTPKQFLISYPLVSKSLRDMNSNKISESSSHCCGMMAQSLGYSDLDELTKNPRNLIFTIELLKIENPGEYEKDSWAMSDSERLSSIPELREKGNVCYKAGDYEKASNQYAEAIGRLEQLVLREKPGEEEWIKLEDMKVPLLLNYAQCKLILEDYYSVIEHTSTVLKRKPDNVKALFRRAKAHVGAWNPDLAKDDFLKVMQLDDSLRAVVEKELNNLEKIKKRNDASDRDKLKGKIF